MLIVDDLLATGGTARAAADLVRKIRRDGACPCISDRVARGAQRPGEAGGRRRSTRRSIRSKVTLLAALIVAGAVAWGALQIAGALRASGAGAGRGDQVAALLTLFAPALAATQQDPRALPRLAADCQRGASALPRTNLHRWTTPWAAGFSFSNERIEAAHAQWTADSLAWELAHDTEFKLKAAVAEQDLAPHAAGGVGRARLDAIEREKLDLYQRRYADYIRTAKALQALIGI